MGKDWFIRTGTPKRDGNKVVTLVDGEEAWLDVLAALNAAKETIHIALWMMHLDHELDRPASLEFKDPADRESRTLHSVLLAARERGVKIRILLWVLPTMPSTEAEILKLAAQSVVTLLPAAGASVSALALLDLRIVQYAVRGTFEVLLQPHPWNPIGSWHQKTILIDDRLAYVGGMNARQNDWDSTHAVFDYRRTPHTSSGKERQKWQQGKKETDYPPRHDFMTHIEGPLVMDVCNNFVVRWNLALDENRLFARLATRLPAMTSPPPQAGSMSAQIVRTMPKITTLPSGEKGCLEMYQKAIANAEQYIYIEDQYFRSQQIAQSLASACARNPKLILVVVTPPDYWAEFEEVSLKIATPSTYWTTDSYEIIKRAVPEFCLFQLQVVDTAASGQPLYVKVNTHAKIMVIDDEWFTIGSCNINERGFIYEGEINVGLHSPEEALQFRMRLWSEHLKTPCPKDIVTAAKLWYDHARKNFEAQQKGAMPVSRVFPFDQRGPLLPMVPKTWF